jgi:hypothetical protein
MLEFLAPGGMGVAFEHTENTPDTPITEEEWEERRRLMNERHELRLAPGRDCQICIDGRIYTAKPDIRYGYVWELPAARANELLAREIDLGGGNWLRLICETVNN